MKKFIKNFMYGLIPISYGIAFIFLVCAGIGICFEINKSAGWDACALLLISILLFVVSLYLIINLGRRFIEKKEKYKEYKEFMEKYSKFQFNIYINPDDEDYTESKNAIQSVLGIFDTGKYSPNDEIWSAIIPNEKERIAFFRTRFRDNFNIEETN